MIGSQFVKFNSSPGRLIRSGLFASVVLSTLAISVGLSRAQGVVEKQVSVASSQPANAARLGAKFLQWAPSTRSVSLSINLPLQNTAQLGDYLQRLSNPSDSLYHHYLTGAQFDAQYGPTQADYDQVKSWAASEGLTITREYSSRTVLNVKGSVAAVQSAFGVKIADFVLPNGSVVYSHDRAPQVPQHIGAIISGVLGLTNVSLHRYKHVAYQLPSDHPSAGTGPAGGLAPSDIKTAYNISNLFLSASGLTPLRGDGQSVALYELDTYTPSDIAQYSSQFGFEAPKLTNVNVDGFNSPPGYDQLEVVLDIDMILALAPNAHIYVYQGEDDTSAVTDIYQQIADDYSTTKASIISTSWGDDEASDADAIAPEAVAFAKMEAQGQTVFVAAGDTGAYENGVTLSVNDPASQPGATGVGGTTLTTKSVGGAYDYETGWDTLPLDNPYGPEGGGGGISSVWPKQSWESGVFPSVAYRQVPDVSLNADPANAYDIYIGLFGGWFSVGGTSATAPLWGSFATLANELRAKNGVTTTLGFANPALYTLGESFLYGAFFHDITIGSNGYYPALPGYDMATGWGSFIGDPLLYYLGSDLSTAPLIASFSPGSGPVGTVVTITGLNLSTTTSVRFNGVAAPRFSVSSLNSVTATVPTGASSGPITLTTLHGSAESFGRFTVTRR